MKIYKALSRKIFLELFFDKYFGGHISIGKITIYGHNAMHWGVNIRTKKFGYICFRLPLPSFDCNKPFFKPLYLYFSPNATPWACTFAIGKDRNTKFDFSKSKLRKIYLGHNFDTDKYYGKLQEINNFYPMSNLNQEEYFKIQEEIKEVKDND